MATDWKALELEYVNSSVTYAELAEKHGLKEGTVRQRANRNGWAEKRNALSREVTAKAQAALTDQRTDELAKFNENDLKVAKGIRSQIAAALTKAQSSKKVMGAQDLRAMAGALEAAQRVGRLALGATTENTGISNPKGGPVETLVTQGIDLSNMTDEQLQRLERAAMAGAGTSGQD